MSYEPTTLEYISAAKDIILAGSAVATALIAYAGLSKWRAELRGRADFDAARAIARAMYKLREALQGARSPLMSHAEFPEGYMEQIEGTPSNDRARALAHAFEKRWSPVWEAIQELNAATLEGEALWGSEIRERMEALRICAIELRVAMNDRIEDTAKGGVAARLDPRHDEATSERLSWGMGSAENQLDIKINSAIHNLEEILRPHLVRGR